MKDKSPVRVVLTKDEATALWGLISWAKRQGYDPFTENAIARQRGGDTRLAASKLAIALGTDPSALYLP